MGTRALIMFQRTSGGETVRYVVVYVQFDGYPSGLGLELANFLCNIRIVNGLSMEDEFVGLDTSQGLQHLMQQLVNRGREPQPLGRVANGFEDLIAQFIALKKQRPGNMYVYPVNINAKDCGADFTYTVNEEDLSVSVNAGKRMTFAKFRAFCCSPDAADP